MVGFFWELITMSENDNSEILPVALERKARIAQPPYLKLAEAIRIIEQIYENGGGAADSSMLTKFLNNSVSSSSFARKLQALKGYRLTTGAVAPVTLTDLGLSVVAPKDEQARLLSLKSAAIGPEAFRKAYERLKGKLLPADEYLSNGFQHDLKLPKVVADAWVDVFKSALETAQLLHQRPDGKTQVLEGPSVSASANEGAVELAEKFEPTPPPLVRGTSERSGSQAVEGHSTNITLADGRIATVFIPDRLSQRDANRLKGALTGIAAIIDSMVEED
jgi:hypothetical protein